MNYSVRMFFAIAAVVASVASAQTPWQRQTAGMTDEQKAEYSRKRTEAMRRRTGGLVINYAKQKGEVLFLNTQKRVPTGPLSKRIDTMKEFFCSSFSLKEWDKPINLANAQATLNECKANAAVYIVDDPSIPVTILAAPETKWIFLNVAALAKDGADDKKVMERTRRELWRALGYLLGNDSVADVCVMKAVTSLKELDELGAEAPSSGPIILISRRLKSIGVEPYQRTSYIRALREGWAPMPTNEIQRAVYDRFMKEKNSGK